MTNPVDYVVRFKWNDLREVASVLNEWEAPPININDINTIAVFGGYYGKASAVLDTWISLYNSGKLTTDHFPSDFKKDLLDAWSLKAPLSRIQSLRLLMCLGQDNWRTKAQEPKPMAKPQVQEKPLYGVIGWTTNPRLEQTLYKMEFYKDRIEMTPVSPSGYARVSGFPIHVFSRSDITNVKFPIEGPHVWWAFSTDKVSIRLDKDVDISPGRDVSIALVAMMYGDIDAKTLKQGEEYIEATRAEHVEATRREHEKEVLKQRIFLGIGAVIVSILLVFLLKR